MAEFGQGRRAHGPRIALDGVGGPEDGGEFWPQSVPAGRFEVQNGRFDAAQLLQAAFGEQFEYFVVFNHGCRTHSALSNHTGQASQRQGGTPPRLGYM